MKRLVSPRRFVLLAVLVGLTSNGIGQRASGGRPPKSKVSHPIVHVPKWQVEYQLQVSDRFSVKQGKGEMYHEPSWNISGSAVVDLKSPDGTLRVVAPDATGSVWEGEANARGSFRGKCGTTPSIGLTHAYVGVVISPGYGSRNGVRLSINAESQTYEVGLALEMDAHFINDAEEFNKKMDEIKPKGSDPIAEELKTFFTGLQNMFPKGTQPFKQSISAQSLSRPLPTSGDGAGPSLSGSRKLGVYVPHVLFGAAEGTFSWTITPYGDSKKPRVELAGCTELGVGQQSTITATAEPKGGTYRFWAEPASFLQIQGEGPTVNVTATDAGRSTLYVEYRAGGKTEKASLPVISVALESVNNGQPIPKLGLYDVDGKRTSPAKAVPVTVRPSGGGDLLSYKPADPRVLAAESEGNAVSLRGLRLGKTTFQASTECGPTGPVTAVEVVRCDDQVIAKLNELLQIANESAAQQRKEYHRLTSTPEFTRAANEIGDSTGDLLIKTGALIIGTLSAVGAEEQAVSTAADIFGYGSNVRDVVLKGEFTSATIQTLIQASGNAVLGAMSDLIETLGAAEKFGADLGALLATSYQLEETAKRLANWNRVIEDISGRIKQCRTGEEEQPPPPEPPKEDPKPNDPKPPKDPKPPRDPNPPKEPKPDPSDPTSPEEPETPPEEPPPPPPKSDPSRFALPYQEGECGCAKGPAEIPSPGQAKTGSAGGAGRVNKSSTASGQTPEIGAVAPGLGGTTKGLKNLGQCVEQFRTGPLTKYQGTLKQWQSVFGEIQAAASADEAARKKAVPELVGRMDSLLGQTKEFDQSGRAFHQGFQTCPDAVESAASELQSPSKGAP